MTPPLRCARAVSGDNDAMPGPRRSRKSLVAWCVAASCAGALFVVVRSLISPIGTEVAAERIIEAAAPSAIDAAPPPRFEAPDPETIPASESSAATERPSAAPSRDEVEIDEGVSIRGSVLDADGLPAANCRLAIRVAREQEERWEYVEVATGESDGEGAFVLPVAAATARDAAIASLVATRGGSEVAVAPIGAVLRAGGGSVGSLRLEPGSIGAVRVRDDGGTPLASVAVTPHGLPQFEVRTGADGAASFPVLPIGAVRFSAIVPGRPLATSGEIRVETGSAFAVEIVVPRGVGVAGRVVDRGERPLPGAIVRVDGALGEAVTGESGEFALEAVGPGARRATVLLGDLPALRVDFEAPRDDLVLRVDEAPVAEFECVDARGRPVEPDEIAIEEVRAAEVAAARSERVRLRLGGAGAIGSFAVKQLAPKLVLATGVLGAADETAPIVAARAAERSAIVALGAGRFRAYARLEDRGPIFVVAKHSGLGIAVAGPCDPTSPDPRTRVEFAAGGRLDVEVVAGSGAPLRAELRIVARDEELLVATTDDAGRCSLVGLPCETILVTASADGAAARSESTALHAGTTGSLRFELEVGTELSGTVLDAGGAPIPGATLRFHAVADPLREYAVATTDRAGGFSVAHAPRGTTRIRIEPNVSGIRFGGEMIDEFLGAPLVVEVTGDPTQRCDLRTLWPAPCRVVFEPRSPGLGASADRFELRRRHDSGSFRVDGPPEALSSGRSEVLAVAPGEYVVTFQGRGSPWYATVPFVLEPGAERTVYCDAPATIPLTGVVEDASGRPLAGVALYFLWTESWRPMLDGGRAIAPFCDVDLGAFRTITASDGSFLVPAGQPRGHVLAVNKKGYEPFHAPIDLDLARRVPLRLRLQPSKR